MSRFLFRSGAALSVVALLLLGVAPAFADGVDVSGSVRVRTEMSDRSFVADTDAAWATWQRTRVALSAEGAGGTTAYVQFQDSRVWGNEGSTLTDNSMVDVHQAWVHADDFMVDGLGMTVGRMEMAYGNQRVIGPVGWSNVGRAFDGVKTSWGMANGWWDAFVLREDAATGRNVWGTVMHFDASENLSIEPLALMQRWDDGADKASLTSIGDYATFSSGAISVEQNFVYQTGDDVSGWLFAADASYDVSGDGNMGVSGGASIYTGDDAATAENEAYTELYPTGHKFHGYMDLANTMTGGLGLKDFHGGGWFSMPSGAKLTGTFHNFSDRVNGDAIGNEIDVVWSHKMAGMGVKVGGGMFMHDTMDEDATWGFVQANCPF
ncbi:MAG: alginate export family protein [Gemmatimonadota bacterium]|nr:alginate export family protein [Gemmatimonadota bacterium]